MPETLPNRTISIYLSENKGSEKGNNVSHPTYKPVEEMKHYPYLLPNVFNNEAKIINHFVMPDIPNIPMTSAITIRKY